ncbi:MAG: hypothetical protein K6F60_05885 [Eubacterium sp.]|nr:hypothetical protein [Eubacterium sp.]
MKKNEITTLSGAQTFEKLKKLFRRLGDLNLPAETEEEEEFDFRIDEDALIHIIEEETGEKVVNRKEAINRLFSTSLTYTKINSKGEICSIYALNIFSSFRNPNKKVLLRIIPDVKQYFLDQLSL